MFVLLTANASTLQTSYGGAPEEQPCWVLLSAPALTLTLPALHEPGPAPVPDAPARGPRQKCRGC